jgi:hypothetical protein
VPGKSAGAIAGRGESGSIARGTQLGHLSLTHRSRRMVRMSDPSRCASGND